jgi:hypothetical protein
VAARDLGGTRRVILGSGGGLNFRKNGETQAALECIGATGDHRQLRPTGVGCFGNLRQVEETVSLSDLYLLAGLLSSDYTQAIQLFLKLPLDIALTLAKAL